MIGNCILFCLLGSFIYMWIWLISLNTITITIEPINKIYINEIDSERQNYNFAGLAVLAFWVVLTHSFAVGLMRHVNNDTCSFQLQQMFLADVARFSVWSMCFLSVYSAGSVFPSDTIHWCHKTYTWFQISFSVAIAPTAFLMLYNAFRIATRNRLQDQGYRIALGCELLNLFIVATVCGLNYIAIAKLQSVVFSVVVLAFLSMLSLFNCFGFRKCNCLRMFFVAGLMICENVFFLANPVLSLSCDCFETPSTCNIEEINESIEGGYSPFAIIFGLLCPSVKATLFILLDAGLRRAFLEYCQFPAIFVRPNDAEGDRRYDEYDGRLLFDRDGNERRRKEDERSLDCSEPDPDDYHDCAEAFPPLLCGGGGDCNDDDEIHNAHQARDFHTPVYDPSDDIYHAPHGVRDP